VYPESPTEILRFEPHEQTVLRPRRKRRSVQRVVVKSFEDCMYLQRPTLYGFRVSVVLSENEPCEIGVSCKGNLIISGDSELPPLDNGTFFPSNLISYTSKVSEISN